MESISIYNLSQTLPHHTKAIRSISCNKNGLVCTGAFDYTCSFFQMEEDKYNFLKTTNYHDDYIYVVRSDVQDRGFFTGSKDKRIIFMDNTGNPLAEFIAHEGTVCSLSQIESNSNWLISGSWDTTAKVWDIQKQTCLFTLPNHSYAVSVLALEGRKFVTGSQDKALHFWDKDTIINTVHNAHDDIIRSIILSPFKDSIYTTSNDEMIKQWSLNGRLLNTFQAHEGFVFSLCCNSKSNELFSSSDDRTVKVWKYNGDAEQMLLHPNTVWDAAINPMNSDLLTACADSVLRVFSNKPFRWLPKEAIKEYNDLCLMQNNTEDNEGGKDQIDIKTLPPITKLASLRNVKDGEIRVFNNQGKGEAYCYKKSENKWELIGEVIGKKDNKKYYPGDNVFAAGEYDYIFDVELEGGVSQLPFNEGGNALVAAEKFVGREKLHKAYVDDIIKFLRANTGKKKPKKPTITEQKPKKQSNIQKKNINTKPQATKNFAFPIMRYFLYDSINAEGPKKKIIELNNTITLEQNNNNKKLSDLQIKQISNVIKILGNKGFYYNSTFNEYDLKEFLSLITSWHNEFLVPVFDTYRMLLLHPESNSLFKKTGGGTGELAIMMKYLKENNNTILSILSMRIITNHFNNESSRLFIISKRQEILDVLGNFIDNDNKHIKTAVYNILFNFSIYLSTIEDNEGTLQVMALINELLSKETNEDNIIILLKALANLYVILEGNRMMGKDIDIMEVVNEINSSNQNIIELKEYIKLLLN